MERDGHIDVDIDNAMTEMTLVAASMSQKCDVQIVPGADDPTLHVTMAPRPQV